MRHNIAEYDVIVSLNTKEVLKNEVNIYISELRTKMCM